MELGSSLSRWSVKVSLKRGRSRKVFLCGLITLALWTAAAWPAAGQDPLPGTQPLQREGDIAAQMVAGIDRFLLQQIDASVAARQQHWRRNYDSAAGYEASVAANRQRLREILGLVDRRQPDTTPQSVGAVGQTGLVARSGTVEFYAVRWPAFAGVSGEGLLLIPRDRDPLADVVAIPDADQTPEQLAGLVGGVPAESQFARRLAESGCRVLVPTLINRQLRRRAAPGQPPRVNLTNREYLYRPAFELGRHLIGYELQKVMAAIDWFEREAGSDEPSIGVIGYGEGGLLALYCGALDRRVDSVCVSGYFGSRQRIWDEPIDRNVFGLLEQFGDAEIASLIAPRMLVVDGAPGPELQLPSEGGAPANLQPHDPQVVEAEKQRLFEMVRQVPPRLGNPPISTAWRIDTEPRERICDTATLRHFLSSLDRRAEVAETTRLETVGGIPKDDARQQRQIDEIDQHTQWLLRDSPFVRREFMKQLDTSSLEKYSRSVEPLRDHFRNEIIGAFSLPRQDAHPRSRKSYDQELWTGYEVLLDVYPDVFAYGILCLPKNIQPGERRPVVVCQHGLEGRPQDVVAGDHRAYHDFAAKLAERGFVTFSPQNIYIGKDLFRTLQRKANPIKKTLFSVMVPQHQQITDWLARLPFVDPERIAFYGLSYGGKSAMRIPPLVDRYCLSICSADFNDWITKCASNRHRYSYVFTIEYEMFEWDLGNTFNYSEMAALIAPRPFMVERGHFDGVAPDEWVAYEYAKVRNLYQAKLGIGERTEIEFFVGPHTINGQGTFAFLHRHLEWPHSTR